MVELLHRNGLHCFDWNAKAIEGKVLLGSEPGRISGHVFSSTGQASLLQALGEQIQEMDRMNLSSQIPRAQWDTDLVASGVGFEGYLEVLRAVSIDGSNIASSEFKDSGVSMAGSADPLPMYRWELAIEVKVVTLQVGLQMWLNLLLLQSSLRSIALNGASADGGVPLLKPFVDSADLQIRENEKAIPLARSVREYYRTYANEFFAAKLTELGAAERAQPVHYPTQNLTAEDMQARSGC